MAEYREYRDAIAAQIEVVADAGRVHPRQRHADDWREYFQKFMTTIDGVQQVRGWWIERTTRRVAEADITDTMGAMGSGAVNWAHTFTVTGVMGFSDARDTDAEFGDLVDDVIDSLMLMVRTPTDFFPGAWQMIPPRLRVQEIRMFGGSILCHWAEIIVIVHKRTAF